jgi:hypothetical protein
MPIRTVASRAVSNAQALAEGFRYSRSLSSARGTNTREPDSGGRLAQYFDEYSEGPGLWKWRHYFPIYERHFARFRGRAVNVTEVGIYSGGSLPMWLDYFGAGAHIYGTDIEDACRAYASDRVDVFIGDQADPAFWKEFLAVVPSIEVFIDDGGHEAHQQIATLKAVLPAISPGGIYLCEDSHGPAHAFHAFVDSLGHALHAVSPGSEPTPFQQHVSSIHRYPLVTVIEKTLLPVPCFEAPKHGTVWEPFLGEV